MRGVLAISVATLVLTTSLPASAATTLAVTGVSATSGPLVGGERISLHGNGFAHVTKVLFGGAKGRSVRVSSAHTLSVVVPGHQAGRVDVRVVTSTGESALTKTDRFTYVAPPAVTSLTGTTKVTIKGKSFSHVKAVLFGKTKGLQLHVVSSTTLTVTAPAHTPGTVDVRVQTAYGTSKTVKADHFTYPAPVVGIPTPLPTPAPVPVPSPPPPAPLVIAATTLPDEVSSFDYAGATLSASGGVPPYTWSASGLPFGLVLSPTGQLSGNTWAAAGQHVVTATVTDSRGVATSTQLRLTVTARAGLLQATGYNSVGQIGNGSVTPVSSPTAVTGLGSVVSVCGYLTHGVAAKSDGTVWAWGQNKYGEVGDGTTVDRLTPVQVPGLSGVTSVACGTLDSYALTADGTVFAWGLGTGGQLGNGSASNSSSPVQVFNATHVTQIAAGDFVAYGVRSDGTVLAWGIDGYGQLGDGGIHPTSVPVAVPGLTGVISIAVSDTGVFALHDDGTVSAWGKDDEGQLGLGGDFQFSQGTPATVPGLSHITQLAAGVYAAYALADDGTVWVWGPNTGYAGNGGFGRIDSPTQLDGLTGVEAVSAEKLDGFAILAGGVVKEWGFDGYGELGDGAAINRLTPVTAPWQGTTLMVGQGAQSLTTYVVKRTKTIVVPPINPIPPPST